jgi:hypothetical protein
MRTAAARSFGGTRLAPICLHAAVSRSACSVAMGGRDIVNRSARLRRLNADGTVAARPWMPTNSAEPAS